MRKTIGLLLLLCCGSMVKAQLKHYITGNRIYYANFFNVETDKPEDFGDYFSFPGGFSYKIEKEKWGAEVWLSQTESFYKMIRYGSVNEGDLIAAYYLGWGLNVQYVVLQHERINISPLAGVGYSSYDATIFDEWGYGIQPSKKVAFYHGEIERKLALQIGTNINIPLYWGIYVNSNVRYNAILNAKNSKQTSLWSLA